MQKIIAFKLEEELEMYEIETNNDEKLKDCDS